MKKSFFKALFTFGFLFLVSGLSSNLSADQAKVTSYYSAPYGNDKDLYVSDSVTVGDALAPGVSSMFGDNNNDSDPNNPPPVLAVKNNFIDGWNVGSSGGNLRVNGNVDIQDGSGNSLFYVNAATSRVGIGTRSPRTALEVRGDAKGMIVTAHQDTAQYSYPWADMFALYNKPDVPDSVTINYGAGAKFAATYIDGDYRFCTLHLDGNPLVFQTILKSGITAAQGKGQVVIRGHSYTPDNNLILVVGEPDAIYGLPLPSARATAWNPWSSIAYKTDVIPLSEMDYQNILSKLAETNIVYYHYKIEPHDSKLHAGFIAEDAPNEITSKEKKAVNLQDEAGFLLASLKALKIENQTLKEKVEKLQKWQSAVH